MKLNRISIILISLIIGFANGYVAADDQRIKNATGAEVVR